MSALRHIVIVAALIAAATLGEARTAMAAEGDKSAERYVSVSATGSVAAEPDMAYISAGVIVEADTAKDALARNSTVMAKLIDGLKALGIAAQGHPDDRPSASSRATCRPRTAGPPPSAAIASSTRCA